MTALLGQKNNSVLMAKVSWNFDFGKNHCEVPSNQKFQSIKQ
jgi:hypothetical protein